MMTDGMRTKANRAWSPDARRLLRERAIARGEEWRRSPDRLAEGAEGVPVQDVPERLDLDQPRGLEEALEAIRAALESGRLLAWSATVRNEQGLPLSEAHVRALDGLMSFSDGPEDDLDALHRRGRSAARALAGNSLPVRHSSAITGGQSQEKHEHEKEELPR